MSTFKNHYETLELAPFADLDEVKSAFRRLARKYHPDTNPDDKTLEDRFKAINEAYEVLGKADKKEIYDQTLRAMMNRAQKAAKASDPNPAPSTKSAKGSSKTTRKKRPKGSKGKSNTTSDDAGKAKASTPPPPPPSSGQDPSSGTSTPINELFENFLKRGFASRSADGSQESSSSSSFSSGGRSRRGEDVTVQVTVDPADAQQGVIKTVNVQHNDICRRCSGTGVVNGVVCTGCNGQKMITRLKKIDVRIPAGVKNGSKVRVAKEGGRGINNGDPGDLFLLIKIATDPTLKIDGLNVYYDLPIAIHTAALGGSASVPTVHGTVSMSIPAGTPSGKVLRLKEQGVHNGSQKGDQFVTILIIPPKNLTAREKELYEELAKLRPDPPPTDDT